MNIRKIAVIGSFAAGAALALAPLAAADPVDITSTLDQEILSLNSQFEFEALLSGAFSDVDKGTGMFGEPGNPFDTIPRDDLNPTFATLLFGVNPDNVSPDPGSYDIGNGSTIQFDDAYNVFLYALLNNNALVPAEMLIGSESSINDALDTGSVMGAIDAFLQNGFADLFGYYF